MNMKGKITSRGFILLEFEDLYGQECSIQESSLVTEPAIWLGVDLYLDLNGNIHKNGSDYLRGSVRMHLSQDQALELIRHLTYFVNSGRLYREDDVEGLVKFDHFENIEWEK